LEFRWHDPRASPLPGGGCDAAPAHGPHDPVPALPPALTRSFRPAARPRATPQSPDRGGNRQERGGAPKCAVVPSEMCSGSEAECGGRRGGRRRGQEGEAGDEQQDPAVAAAPRHRGIPRVSPVSRLMSVGGPFLAALKGGKRRGRGLSRKATGITRTAARRRSELGERAPSASAERRSSPHTQGPSWVGEFNMEALSNSSPLN